MVVWPTGSFFLPVCALSWHSPTSGGYPGLAEQGVTAALAQAETLVEEGDKLIDHPERWQATARLALSALEKAEELLTAGVETRSLTGRVEQVRAAVDEAVADSGLLVELDRIRLEQAAVKDGHFNLRGTASLYAKLLGSYGVDLAASERAAARVRDSRLREPLVAALADWWRVTKNKGDRQRIEQVVQAVVPPDGFLTRCWEAARRRDRAASSEQNVRRSACRRRACAI